MLREHPQHVVAGNPRLKSGRHADVTALGELKLAEHGAGIREGDISGGLGQCFNAMPAILFNLHHRYSE